MAEILKDAKFSALEVTGDFLVSGTTTSVNTQNTTITDTLLELNSGLTAFDTNVNDSGILIQRGAGDNAFMGWDESASAFVFGTTTATADSTGDLTIVPASITNLNNITTSNISSSDTINITSTNNMSITSGNEIQITSDGDTSINIVQAGNDTTGGVIALVSGSGGASNTGNAGNGGDISMVSGTGGNGSAAGLAGNGGSLLMFGSAGGNGVSNNNGGGNGGSVRITAGSGGGAHGAGNNGQGGDVQITSGGSTTPALAGSVNIQSTKNADNAIVLNVNGGIDETIRINSNQGTGVNITGASQDASISLLSDAGGIGLYSGLNANNAVTLEAVGQVATRGSTILMTSSDMTNSQAIKLTTTNGGGIMLETSGTGVVNVKAGRVIIDDTTEATSITDGSLQTDGGLSVTRSAVIGGRVIIEDTTEATSAIDGSLQTDGGLSVLKSAVIGDDLDLLSNGAIFKIGFTQPFTLTHSNANNTLLATANHRLAFGTAGEYIFGDGTDLILTSTGVVNVSAGRVTIDDTTEATSTTDGSLQTDGGLSVAKSAVIGDDLDLLSNGAIFKIGSDQPFTLTHSNANNTLLATANHRLAFGTAGAHISGNGTDLILTSSGVVNIESNLEVTGTISGVTSLTLDAVTITTAEIGVLVDVTAGTAAASKALVLSADKDIGTIRNLTINGTFSDGNYTFDTNGSVSGLGTVGCGAITSSGNLAVTGTITGETSLTLDAVTITTAQIGVLDGVTAGTVVNNKAVVYGSSGEVNATTLQIAGTSITSTAAELNILDGVTSTAAELNILDGVTATTAELNILDGVTSTAAELNILDGVTATTAELNILDGVTSSTAELNVLDGVTAGTAAASKALVLSADKDIGTIRNLTINGTFSDGNYTFDTNGNVAGLGTVGCGAITSSGAITSGGLITAQGDGSSVVGKIKLNCSNNSHGQTLMSQPHSASDSSFFRLPLGSNAGNDEANPDILLSGDRTIATVEAKSGGGSISLDTLHTAITTTGNQNFSLANGSNGQLKIISLVVDGGDATLTPGTFSNGTTITFNDVGDTVMLIYNTTIGWTVISNTGATIA